MRNPLTVFKKIHLLSAWLGLAALAISTASCVKPPAPTVVKYIVPEGFRGVFQITELDAPAKAAPLKEHQLNVIEIPPSGLVQMQDTTMYMVTHKVKCVTTSGKDIPYARPDSPAKGIHIFPIYSKSGEDQYYLVGTAEERDYIWANGKSFIKLAKQVLPDAPADADAPASPAAEGESDAQ